MFYVKMATKTRIRVLQKKVATESAGKPKQCPVVWIWSPDSVISDRVAANFPPFGVHSSYYFLTNTKSLPGNITREQIAYSVNILRGRSTWTEEQVRVLLASLPENQKPRLEPWHDQELRSFTGPALAIAAGVKYAGDRVVVVADYRFTIDANLQTFAHRRGIEIVRLAWDVFGQDVRRRIAFQHTAPSQDPYKDPPAAIMRQIPPVPAFFPRITKGDGSEE
ncbi:MAG: hypothetical protein NT105_11430 [Verrucomicrobia bacterium]|nr:hypothetical protein [Verrucomicrobiota bacterium]